MLTCTGCDKPLAEHCDHCGWLRCLNTACTHRLYDLQRGLLTYTDGRTEQAGATQLPDDEG